MRDLPKASRGNPFLNLYCFGKSKFILQQQNIAESHQKNAESIRRISCENAESMFFV
ncbi:hypothetical protein ACWIUD_05425 [Helicobacter sp. 23-1044]